MRSVVIDLADYDWQGDTALHRPMSDTIIYELHVRGFSRSTTSAVTAPGTFPGRREDPLPAPARRHGGRLLPVCQFDEHEYSGLGPTGVQLANYWGYGTLGFLAPHAGYCLSPLEGSHLREFRDMVKALHVNGIEVILDVVFDHTAEGDQQGPTVSFRGLENAAYYLLDPDDRQYYMNYSGCGNTVNCNHPTTDKFILDCLEFWVRDMHVDGFRFDEGSVLAEVRTARRSSIRRWCGISSCPTRWPTPR